MSRLLVALAASACAAAVPAGPRRPGRGADPCGRADEDPSYHPSTRAGGPTGQPPLSSRPGGVTGPARPTIGSAGTAGPGGTANRGPLGAGGVPHGSGAPHGSNSDDKHTRAPWLLEDDPDAIWFAGLPGYTDPVISAERGHR